MSAEWIYAASVRALRTAAQVAAALVITGTVIWKLNWEQIGGVTATALVLSLLTSLAGLPEIENIYGVDTIDDIDNRDDI